tara:strand:+ start:264 stop:683 length:420 start_codon:yes stop_codon:yes gene_type:complete
MTIHEPLPVTIESSNALKTKFSHLRSINNRLEAQINFQTLTANWYSIEENILHIQLNLVTQEELESYKIKYGTDFLEAVADDIFGNYQTTSNHLQCFIAITTGELTLLQQQQKLLTGYIQLKVIKVINLIANKMQLPTI